MFIHAIIAYHKKKFKRNPVVITVLLIVSLSHLVDVRLDDLFVETLMYYYFSFNFIPAFFNNLGMNDESFREWYKRQQFHNEPRLRLESHYASHVDKVDPNRFDPHSPLYITAIGKRLG